MIIIAEVRGKFIIAIDKLLSEFNPEVAEEARKELEISISEITDDGWYNNQNLRKYLSKVNNAAQNVLGKKMAYAAGKQFDELISKFEKPVDFIKFTIENDTNENFRKENRFKTQLLDSGDDFVKMKMDTDGMPLFYEGLYQGVLEKYHIIRTNINFTIEKETDEQQICTMEIKWQ